MSGGALRLEALEVRLEGFRLAPLTLAVEAGTYLVIVGPTGAGKTLILETIAGLRRPAGGQLFLDGAEITALPPERRQTGFVYQDYLLFPHLTVAENIAYGLRRRGLRRRERETRVEALAAMLGIEPLLDRRPATLSGGEAQRVALARALAVEPRLLLLDEPLSALDPATRLRLRGVLARLHDALGMTIIHVTHDFEEAFTLGDRVAVIHEGQLLQVGTPEEVFRRPNSEQVARFVGVQNLFRGRLQPLGDGYSRLHLDDISITVVGEAKGEAHLSIRPEEIVLSREPLHSSARNSFRGRITAIEDRGTLAYVAVEVPPVFTSVITHRSLEEMGLRVGEEVHIAFKASAVHLF